MPDRLAGKNALVTGAASGIGRAAAERIINEGGNVVVADINQSAGEALVGQLGQRARFIPCDVTVENDVRDAIVGVVEQFGRLDILVNNAGMITYRPVTDISIDLWDKVFAVNTRSSFLAIKHATPYLKAAGGGSIINIASMAGLRGAPGLSVYSASKAAIVGLSTTLALELAPSKIRVNAVCPGWVDTEFNQPVVDVLGGTMARDEVIRSSIPLQRQGSAAEIAALIAYLASDESAFITAQAISINGGAYN
jgi:dihydroanticapsin dehydrogenase